MSRAGKIPNAMPEIPPKPESNTESSAEQAPRRVFIEVGAGSAPFSFWGKRKIGENETYVDIDIDKDSAASAKSLAERHPQEMGEGRRYVVRGDAKNLPLADAWADEVFMGNVLSDE